MATHLTSEHFNSLVQVEDCFHKKHASLFHMNARSLRNKHVETEAYLSQLDCCLDFLAFSETWYSDDAEVHNFVDYKHVSVYRSGRRGGGVSLYVHQRNHFYTLREFTCMCDDFETVAIVCRNFLIAVVYRPPQAALSNFLDYVETLLHYANANK